jgi:hypothetical protein
MMAMSGFGSGLQIGTGMTDKLIGRLAQARGLAQNDRRMDIQEKQGDRELTIAERRSRAEYGEDGLAERRVKVAEEGLDIERDKLAADPNVKWSRARAMKPVKSSQFFTQLTNSIPETRPFFQPLLDALDDEQITSRGQVYDTLMSAHKAGQFAPLRVSLREKAAKLKEQGKAKEAAQYMALYTTLGKNEFVKTVNTIMDVPKELWQDVGDDYGEPTMDKSIPGGVLTQENMSTGEVKKIAQPSGKAVGKRFYDANGNLIYEEGDLKTIPAAQAEKQASLITAMANLDEMDKLMSAGEQEGVDMTGFWEITNKYVDNWNLLDKQSLKRADLRQRVAMSLKFMYDVMGRQLAVQELKKGEAMLPDMKVDEAVFKNRVANLRDYMVAMLVANKDVFQQLGYEMRGLDLSKIDKKSKGYRGAMDDMGAELERRARAEGMDEAQIDQYVESELRRRFGE